MVLSTLANIILLSAEKVLLARSSSVTALAHYGVAASLAGRRPPAYIKQEAPAPSPAIADA